MKVGVLTIRLHIPGNNSLKGKRMVLKSIKDRVRHHFNVSIAEVAEHDLWQVASLGVAFVSNDHRYLDEVLCKVTDMVRSCRNADLIDHHMEILNV